MAPVRKRRRARTPAPDLGDPRGMQAMIARHLEWLSVTSYAATTAHVRGYYLGSFERWCAERGMTKPAEVTKPILERYQRWLYHYRKKDGRSLSFHGQYTQLIAVRAFFRWAARAEEEEDAEDGGDDATAR